MPTPIEEAAASTSKRLNEGDLAIQRRLATMYADAFQGALEEQRKFARYVESQQAKGVTGISWLMRDERYLALQSKLIQSIAAFGTALEGFDLPEEVTQRLDFDRTRQEAAAATGSPGIAIVQPGFDAGAWSVINHHAIRAAYGMLSSDTSPLKQLIKGEFSREAELHFRQTWQRGLLLGQNPNRIASKLAKGIANLTLGRAQLIARTEFHRAYREGKRQQFQESSVIGNWIWRAAQDRRTCGICWMMHGTEHKKTEILAGHPACRCVMIPKTQSWEDLGLPGVPNTHPKFEPGASMFRRLPRDRQLQLIGPSRLKMFESGVKLRDLTHTVVHPKWGPMQKFKPLSMAKPPPRVGGGGSQYGEDAYRNPFEVGVVWSSVSNYRAMQAKSEAWGAKWGNKIPFSIDEMAALSRYRGSYYEAINNFLRRLPEKIRISYGLSKGVIDDIRMRTVQIEAAMMKSTLSEAALVYRGTSFRAINGATGYDDLKRMVGQTFEEPGFLSTATMNPFGGKVQLVITAPKGARAVWMSDGNTGGGGDAKSKASNGENEVLFDRHTRMRITKVEPPSINDRGQEHVRVHVEIVEQVRAPLPGDEHFL